uniref:Endoglucanase 9 n=1 Tax=Lygus hesperus TaxID=30085 RepID=A0A0A9W7B1_LYGHE
MLTVELLTIHRKLWNPETCRMYGELQSCIDSVLQPNSIRNSSVGYFTLNTVLLRDLLSTTGGADSPAHTVPYEHAAWLFPDNVVLPQPHTVQQALLLLSCCLHTLDRVIVSSEQYAASIGLELDWGEDASAPGVDAATMGRRGRPRKPHHPHQQFLQEFGDWVVEDGYYI